jgi:hypothetical protein
MSDAGLGVVWVWMKMERREPERPSGERAGDGRSDASLDPTPGE